MAGFFRVQLGVVSRSEGHSAAKRSAYQSCGVVIDHEGLRFDFRRKAREHVATIMLAPSDAPEWTAEPEELWRRAGAMEKRRDAQEARIIDFSMPREIPYSLWETCIRHVYNPFCEAGMVMQVDIHDSPASDGGRNVNVHGLSSLRRLQGDSFSRRKERTWNDWFRERDGRVIRELLASRLTGFCQAHGIAYEADVRPNSERDRPAREPELPRWNFEVRNRTGEETEALRSLQTHRRKRREWEQARAAADIAHAEIIFLEKEIRRRQECCIGPADPRQRHRNLPDRRAAILRAWHGGSWIQSDAVRSFRSLRFDESRDHLLIDLLDGTRLIDSGTEIRLIGRVTVTAARELAAAAERHGWTSVRVRGSRAFKEAVTFECALRGIPVVNHKLSSKDQERLERVLAEKAMTEMAAKDKSEGIGPFKGTNSAASQDLPASAALYKQLLMRRGQETPFGDDDPSRDTDAPPAYAFRPPRKKRPEERETAG